MIEFQYAFYRYRSKDENHELVARLSLEELNARYQKLRRRGGGKAQFRINVELEIRERRWIDEEVQGGDS